MILFYVTLIRRYKFHLICVTLWNPNLNAIVLSVATVSSSSFLAVSTRKRSIDTDGVAFAYFAPSYQWHGVVSVEISVAK